MSNTRLNVAARSVIDYFERRGKRHGAWEARRDWLYGPAHVPPSSWDMDGQLDIVLRRVKDFDYEFVYVYDRPPVWTCRPTDYIRDRNEEMEFQRQITGLTRLARIMPSGAFNERLALSVVASQSAALSMLRVRIGTTNISADPVLARIDATSGMAN